MTPHAIDSIRASEGSLVISGRPHHGFFPESDTIVGLVAIAFTWAINVNGVTSDLAVLNGKGETFIQALSIFVTHALPGESALKVSMK